MQRLLLTSGLTVLFALSGASALRAQGGYDPFAAESEAIAAYDAYGNSYDGAPQDITGSIDLGGLSGGVGSHGSYYGGPGWRVAIMPHAPLNSFEQRRAASWAYVAGKRNPR